MKRQYQSYLVTTLQSVLDNMSQVSTGIQEYDLIQIEGNSGFNPMCRVQSLVSFFQDEQDDSLIVIFIAETDPDYVYQISAEVQKQFQKYLGW